MCVPLFLPLTIGVVAGDTIAGEASHGTLRYLVIAPAGRLRLLGVKYAGCAAFCVAAALVVGIAGALIGMLLFPIGPVTLLSGATVCTWCPAWQRETAHRAMVANRILALGSLTQRRAALALLSEELGIDYGERLEAAVRQIWALRKARLSSEPLEAARA